MRSSNKKFLPSRRTTCHPVRRPFSKQIARREKMTSPAALSPSNHAWENEREKMLARICRSIKAKRARGFTLNQAIKWPCWYWQDRTYRNTPDKKICLSRPSLLRIYYAWINSGGKRQALRLNYARRKQKITYSIAKKFLRHCLASGVVSMVAAFKNFNGGKKSAIKLRHFRDEIPGSIRAKIRLFQLARVRAVKLDREFQKFIARLTTKK